MSLDVVLERLAATIYHEAWASNGKIKGVFQPARLVPKSVALRKPVLQINGPRRIAYLSFDIDRRFAGMAWADANLPPPNLIVVNPDNLHAHLIYELREPVWLPTKEDKRPGMPAPVRYLKAVQKAMRRALDGDTGYSALMTKNPFYASWRVTSPTDRQYSLAELSEHLELGGAEAEIRENPDGRNCTLFDTVRFWGYRNKKDFTDFDDFSDALQYEIDRVNGEFPEPLDYREVAGIAKSVCHWIWNNYTGSGDAKRRRIMGLDPTESLRVRQQKGQEFSCQVKTDSTIQKIQRAVAVMTRDGTRLTRSAVAAFCKLHRHTVARYWSVISFDSASTSVTPNPYPSLPSVRSVAPVPSPVPIRETEALRAKSSPSLRSGRQGDTLIHTQQYTSETLTYQQVYDRYPSGDFAMVKAKLYAMDQADLGILVEGVPETLKPQLRARVDNFRNQRKLN